MAKARGALANTQARLLLVVLSVSRFGSIGPISVVPVCERFHRPESPNDLATARPVTRRANDLAAQSVFVKNAPPGMVEFCKNEAQDVEIPLFGRNRNLTVEGQLAREPAMFALMKTAQQVRDTWAREDRAAAEAQRAAAEDANQAT